MEEEEEEIDSGEYTPIETLPEHVSILKTLLDVSSQAVWTLSSAKPGNGVSSLIDENLETFWQSNAELPHSITISFSKRMRIAAIRIFADISLDESYTPKLLTIGVGSSKRDVHVIKKVDIADPNGWILIPLAPEFIWGQIVEIFIISNHRYGRDVHVRAVQVLVPSSLKRVGVGTEVEFVSHEMRVFSEVR